MIAVWPGEEGGRAVIKKRNVERFDFVLLKPQSACVPYSDRDAASADLVTDLDF